VAEDSSPVGNALTQVRHCLRFAFRTVVTSACDPAESRLPLAKNADDVRDEWVMGADQVVITSVVTV